ncbi:hypothetical protein ACWEN4_30080 [Streptomyces violaceorubidus]
MVRFREPHFGCRTSLVWLSEGPGRLRRPELAGHGTRFAFLGKAAHSAFLRAS